LKEKKDVQVSIIVTARNDDHGGGFLQRMQVFTNALIAQCDRHKLRAELIVVEWNPMPERQPLYEVLSWPEKSEYCSVRFIEVPPEIHNSYKYSENLGLYQMIAKNVGIRRSRADFIVATNIDILFSDDLIKFMASGKMRERVSYRVDRYDIPEDVPVDAPVEEQLEYCRQNLIRNNERDGTRNFMTGKYFPTYVGLYTDSTRLHFNACGDFTLMSKNDWYRLRGYPEFDMYSAHIDSIMLLMTYHDGIQQEILPDTMQTYHIEHSSSMIAEKASKLFKDLNSAGVPQVKITQIEEWAREMNISGRPILFNGPDWGHVSEVFKDTYILRAERDRNNNGNGSSNNGSEEKANLIFLSVIVAGTGNAKSIGACLDSLSAQTLSVNDFEVLLVADQNSDHNELINKYKEKIDLRVIHPDIDGLSAAYAAAVREAGGEAVVFINHDSIADVNMLHEHFHFHKNNPPVNKDIWAHLNFEHAVMVGRREWDRNLDITPLMESSLKEKRAISDGESLEWHYFKCDNLSCNRDFIIRYGNFDETFNVNGDLDLGYRLSRHGMKMIYIGSAKSYRTAPLTLERLKEIAFAEGHFAYALGTKYLDEEVHDWCRVKGSRARVADLEKEMSEVLNKLQSSHEFTNEISLSYDRFREYHRSQGLISAESEKADICKRVFKGKLFEQARHKDEKTVLVISETLPLHDINQEDKELLAIIEVLARNNTVTFLSRKGVEKGKYIENLRKIGVSVFYDIDGLQEQVMVESKSVSHASQVEIGELLTHRKYDVILLQGPEIATLYMNPARDYSSQSVVMINTIESWSSNRKERAGKLYVYNEADVVIAYPEAAGRLSSVLPEQDIKILPDTGDYVSHEKSLKLIMDKLPLPQNKHLEKFRIFTDSISNSSFWSNKTEMTVIFILNDNLDTSIQSLQSLLKYSNPELSNMIVAINNKRCDGAGDSLERESRHYFRYDNQKELDIFIAEIIKGCSSDYIAIVESSVIVSTHWDRRLVAHLKNRPEIGIITARNSEFSYKSTYDFERDAHKIFQSDRGRVKYSEKVNTPCLAINRSLCKKDGYSDLKGLLLKIMATHKIAIAQDTYVFHIKNGLRIKKHLSFGRTIRKKLSIIMPASNGGERLRDSINSLCLQKEVDYRDVEIIVIYSGADKGTASQLSSIEAPCSFQSYIQKGRGLSAALNYGLGKAYGEYVLFVSQESVAQDNLINEHLNTHLKHEGKDTAVLGHISLSGMDGSSPLMQYLSKNPRLPFASPMVYNFNDITRPEDAGHFYLPNISLKRAIFNEVGAFDDEMPDEWAGIEFGSRFSLNGYKVSYNRKSLVACETSLNLKEFLDEQVAAGRQFAVMAYRHPEIWHIEGARSQCLYYYYEKQGLFERVKEIACELEDMTDDKRGNYKYAGTPLLEKCYYMMANYCFASGIYDVVTDMESTDWMSKYAQIKGVDTEDIINENRAYEMLFEGYWHIGRCDHQTFSRYIERSSGIMEGHPSAYYAAGNFYFDLNEFKLAEDTFEQGIEKRKNFREDLIFPVEDESLYSIWLAMSCIPQGKYSKAAAILESLIGERLNLSEEQEALTYKCLSMSYRHLGDEKRAAFCKEEAERLGENIRTKEELLCVSTR
jgi:glycosyltransferase involved in cell wall biosynthesis